MPRTVRRVKLLCMRWTCIRDSPVLCASTECVCVLALNSPGENRCAGALRAARREERNVSMEHRTARRLDQGRWTTGATVADVAASIGAGLAKAALAGIVNGTARRPGRRPSPMATPSAIVTAKSAEGLRAPAPFHGPSSWPPPLADLYPGVKFGVGPAIEDGFYYDVELPEGVLSPDDFAAIEARMAEIVKADAAFRPPRWSPATEARGDLRRPAASSSSSSTSCPRTQPSPSTTIGNFTDLCRGPHAARPPARSAPSSSRSWPAPTGSGDVETRDAHPPLRHGVLQEGGAGRVSAQPGRGREARPPQARAASWAST